MRTLLLLLLLLPCSLYSQVKILMPVVAKDASGQAVTDLKASDFQISSPKNTSIETSWLVSPETVGKEDAHTPIVVLYDAANSSGSYPEVTGKRLRDFLRAVAQHRAPVTFLVDSADGIRLIYSPTTSPEVLLMALSSVEQSKGYSTDPKVARAGREVAVPQQIGTSSPLSI